MKEIDAANEYLAAPEVAADKRMKVKLGGTYGHELVGHWFYLHPADEFAEKALEQRTGIAAQQPATFLEADYYVYNIDGVYRLADPQPTIRWGTKC